jgi:alpha-D-xyloside xylohydrolase
MGECSPALYKRWVAFGLLCSHSRLHGSSNYRVPWLFDEESVIVLRQFTKLKNRLFPYIYAAAHDAAAHGWPVLRAMFLEYPDDPACRHLDRQYMLGSSLLVAPVVREDDVAQYYLPEGRWTHLLSNKIVEGGRWQAETLPFTQVPLFVRENTVLAMSASEDQPAWRLSDPLTLNLFHIADGADLLVSIPSSDRDGAAMFNCKRSADKITLSGDGYARNVQVVLRCRREVQKIANGKMLRETPEGLLMEWADTSKPFVLTVND